ncbi:MAG: valine--tRNA ligase, partial [Candidatus Latescibacteria bacterium]|nr:valine--tRNA ligase [Candidatus Latescibacterota bacterium]
TRPETMLGDTAVAVHPDDERYADLVGQTVTLPLMDREIPIIADEILVDKEFGSGAVKVTSAHDFNDFETGVRHSLEMISILDEDGVANENAGEYQGLDRFEAREKIVSDLESLGLMRGVKDHAHPLAACQRCETVVEPRLSLQWFVDIKSLASSAIDAVVNGDTVIRPESWTKTYLNWMNNIEDWCISRQLWWGHQIPAWFCQACNEITVARDEPLACGSCGSANIERDPDVLDTWFSSGLWPFSTMGWPDTESNDALNTFYPTAVMETGYDILFLWVSRMMILGLHFMDEVPFKEVYLHGMVCAADGQKMSKVKGNIIDPLDVVEEIGADALRFSMAAATGQGHVVRADQERMMGYRNFINKIWNAARFALPHVQELEPREFDADTLDLSSADRWLLSRLSRTVESVNCELAEFRFSDAALTIYHFFWHELCDWYLELIKPQLFGEDSPKSEATKRTLVHALDVSLRVLHPFAPFITEEIWQKLPIPHDAESIMISPFPTGDKALIDENAESQISLVQEVIAGIRNVRAEMNVPPGKHAPALIRTSGAHLDALNCLSDYLTDLAKIESLTIGANVEKPAHSGTVVIGDMTEVYVPLEGLIDVDQERARLSKELGKQEKYVTGLKKKLSNEQFLSKAPPEVVDAEREKLTAGVGQQDRLRRNLDALTA